MTNRDLLNLQEEFIVSGFKCPKYYTALVEVVKNQIVSLLVKSGYGVSAYRDNLNELAHDAVTRFLEQYWKHDNYKIEKSIIQRVYKEAQFVLYTPTKVYNDSRRADLDENMEFGLERLEVIEILDQLSSIDLYHLFSSRSYKAAILALEQSFGSRDKVYKKAVALKQVWDVLHKGENV